MADFAQWGAAAEADLGLRRGLPEGLPGESRSGRRSADRGRGDRPGPHQAHQQRVEVGGDDRRLAAGPRGRTRGTSWPWSVGFGPGPPRACPTRCGRWRPTLRSRGIRIRFPEEVGRQGHDRSRKLSIEKAESAPSAPSAGARVIHQQDMSGQERGRWADGRRGRQPVAGDGPSGHRPHPSVGDPPTYVRADGADGTIPIPGAAGVLASSRESARGGPAPRGFRPVDGGPPSAGRVAVRPAPDRRSGGHLARRRPVAVPEPVLPP